MQDNKPLISVIVPVYNADTYLEHCLQSLISQTYSNLQILIVNDSSTDHSADIIAHYADSDKRITPLSQPHAGQAAARNLGLKHANGELTAFVDADDYITPTYLSDLYSQLTDHDIVQTGYTKVTTDRQELYNQLPKNKHQFTSACMRLYRSSIIRGITFQQGLFYEDVLFSIDVWKRKPSIVMSNNCGYCYTLNPSSTTSTIHPQDRKALFHLIRKRLIGADLATRTIILYTIIRLHLYFLHH